ncbi:MAG: hypothetical protein AABZ60_14825 [Planctomycetota bacterium]
MSDSEKPLQNPVPDPQLVLKKPDRATIPPASKYTWTMFIFYPIKSKEQKK